MNMARGGEKKSLERVTLKAIEGGVISTQLASIA